MVTRILLLSLTIISICVNSYSGMRFKRQSSYYNPLTERFRRIYRSDEGPEKGNICPESTPWPCKTPNHCLSFDFICDENQDCPDGYDEDPNLCTAKDRPALEMLEGFIMEFKSWLVPKYLGNGEPRELALRLIESKTIDKYAEAAKLTATQKRNLAKLMKRVAKGQAVALMMDGMPTEAWSKLFELFGRIESTGFLGKNRE